MLEREFETYNAIKFHVRLHKYTSHYDFVETPRKFTIVKLSIRLKARIFISADNALKYLRRMWYALMCVIHMIYYYNISHHPFHFY